LDSKKIQNVFFISDSTGITIESLGHSLFTQFPDITFEKKVFPFVTKKENAEKAISHIKKVATNSQNTPIVFTSLADEDLKNLFAANDISIFDIFSSFIPEMESHLKTQASHAIGETHGVGNTSDYLQRIDALNFALSHDDGLKLDTIEHADIILTGVSRSGKTPTCLYLAMHYNLKTANYPLTDSDFENSYLPETLRASQDQIFGLTISPTQLCKIRTERKPNSKYASFEQCEFEIKKAESIYKNSKLPFIDTSSVSIEEIATTIIQRLNLKPQGKW